jgi:hypothetical protein
MDIAIASHREHCLGEQNVPAENGRRIAKFGGGGRTPPSSRGVIDDIVVHERRHVHHFHACTHSAGSILIEWTAGRSGGKAYERWAKSLSPGFQREASDLLHKHDVGADEAVQLFFDELHFPFDLVV